MGLGYRRPSPHPVPQRVLDHAWDAVEIRANGCWPWTMSTASHGYGQIGWGGSTSGRGGTVAHRAIWQSLHGPIPAGMTVDHLCRNRTCVNPFHLRLLSNVENARLNGASQRKRCPKGHRYDASNTLVDRRGHRRCRTCAAAQ